MCWEIVSINDRVPLSRPRKTLLDGAAHTWQRRQDYVCLNVNIAGLKMFNAQNNAQRPVQGLRPPFDEGVEDFPLVVRHEEFGCLTYSKPLAGTTQCLSAPCEKTLGVHAPAISVAIKVT